jgi:uncharacterized membrane protein YbhN (UPF0104 family)
MKAYNTTWFRGHFRWFARLVTIGLLGWVAWKQDWKALGSILSNSQGILILIASVGSMLIGQICATIRWLILLRVENPNFYFSQAFKLTLISAFASLFLPTTAGGDMVRIVSLKDRNRAASVSVVAIDRIVSVASVISLVPLSIIALYPYLGSPKIGLVTGFAVCLAVAEPSWMRRFFTPIISFLKDLKKQLLSWRQYPGRLALAFFLALGSNALGWLSVWLISLALSIHVSYWLVVAVGVWIYAAGMLPIAINGLGVQETGYVYFYELISAASDTLAATLGLLTRLVYVLAVLPGGIWLAFSPEIRHSLHKPGA